MKYETEINEMLNMAIPKESWMTDNEHNEIIDETFKQMGITKKQLSDDIETGVKNGYIVEQQIEVLKLALMLPNGYCKNSSREIRRMID